MVAAAIGAHRPGLLINAAAFNDVDGAEVARGGSLRDQCAGSGQFWRRPRPPAGYRYSRSRPTTFSMARCGVPITNTIARNPLSAYGASKLAGEAAVRAANPRHYIVRTAWLFWEEGKNFLLSMYRLAGRPQLKVVSDQASSPTYVPHLARAIARL